MKLHRFYVGDLVLDHELWFREKALVHQWTKVLRFQVGRDISLFNDHNQEKLYRILQIEPNALKLQYLTDAAPLIPDNNTYLCFSLLKKDKNDWVLQKGTELGIRHFIPLICDRTEKIGFDIERAERIVIEASEQCGRADIPKIREPIGLKSLLSELHGKVDIHIAEQGSPQLADSTPQLPQAVLVGPEGGWSDSEKQLFLDKKCLHMSLSRFTLRAETAAITAAAKVCG